MTGEEAAAVKRDGWDPLWGCLSSEKGASQHVLRWDPQDRLDETQGSRQEGSMTPSEFLSVSIHKLVEETGARSQETWVLTSTLSLPTREQQFPGPPDGMMVPILLSSQACQNCPGVRGDECHRCVWSQAFLLKPPPSPDLLPPTISLQKARADPPPYSLPLSLLSASFTEDICHVGRLNENALNTLLHVKSLQSFGLQSYGL